MIDRFTEKHTHVTHNQSHDILGWCGMSTSQANTLAPVDKRSTLTVGFMMNDDETVGLNVLIYLWFSFEQVS